MILNEKCFEESITLSLRNTKRNAEKNFFIFQCLFMTINWDWRNSHSLAINIPDASDWQKHFFQVSDCLATALWSCFMTVNLNLNPKRTITTERWCMENQILAVVIEGKIQSRVTTFGNHQSVAGFCQCPSTSNCTDIQNRIPHVSSQWAQDPEDFSD